MSQELIFEQQVRNTANVTLDVLLTAITNSISAAYGQANSAYTQANAAVGLGQTAYGQANLAYNQANTATSVGQAAYSQANTAYNQANTATSAASAAQNTANQGISATGVSAGSYGTGTRIPAFTVGANGRLSQANTIAIPAFSTATNGLVTAPSSSGNTAFLDSAGAFVVPLGGGDQSIAATGWTTLPGGLILQWGSFTTVGGNVPTTTGFPKGFPTACFQVHASAQSEVIYVESQTAGDFVYITNSAGQTGYYWAIGH